MKLLPINERIDKFNELLGPDSYRLKSVIKFIDERVPVTVGTIKQCIWYIKKHILTLFWKQIRKDSKQLTKAEYLSTLKFFNDIAIPIYIRDVFSKRWYVISEMYESQCFGH